MSEAKLIHAAWLERKGIYIHSLSKGMEMEITRNAKLLTKKKRLRVTQDVLSHKIYKPLRNTVIQQYSGRGSRRKSGKDVKTGREVMQYVL